MIEKSKLKDYHFVWLDAHKERSVEWLKSHLKDGFDIHHVDGNHDNNDPSNLVLIEHRDHFMLHSGSRPIKSARMRRKRKSRYEKKGEKIARIIRENEERVRLSLE